MFDYIPDVFKEQYATTPEEGDRWYTDPDNNRRPPELLPRDEVARAINSEVKAGRGSPHGGVFLDIASRLKPEEIQKRLPSMYHQFKELAGVDITTEPMEVGPTCHYVMGGVEVDAVPRCDLVGRDHEGNPRFHGAEGAAFDAGHLHVSGNRITRHSEVMLERRFRGVLDFERRGARDLRDECRGHRGGDTDFGLAAPFGCGEGGVVLAQVAHG